MLLVRVFWNRNQEMRELALTLLSAGVARVLGYSPSRLSSILRYSDVLMEAGSECGIVPFLK